MAGASGTIGSVLINGLSSSISALTLSQPTAIAALVGLGIVAVGSVVEISYGTWKKYEAAKHGKAIDRVNDLHEQYLKNIIVPGQTKIPDLPVIFEYDKEKKTVLSLHYNDAQVRDIGKVVPDVPMILTRYRQSVLDALLKLKEYYFEQPDDVTAGVLSYLMNVLQNRCLSFVGYDYDIAYLNALINFINAYASQEGRENTPHFDRLKRVYTYLLDAVQDLEKHKESMSLHDLVDEARNTCLSESNNLIRLLVKMVVPEKYQAIADTVTHEELKKDILRYQYIDKEFAGISLSKTHEIDLPKVIFHEWISGLAKYYLLSQSPKAVLNEEKILRPEDLFAFVRWAREIKKQQKPSKADKNRVHDELNSIHKVFEQAPNFINSKLIGTDKSQKFVTVSTDEEILDAIDVMAHYAHLTHGIISLQALCTELTSAIEQLGLDFFDNEDNFNKIFIAFNTVYLVVQNDLKVMKDKIKEILTANKNTMRLMDKKQLQTDINNALVSIEVKLLHLADKVRMYKNKQPQTVETSVNDALDAADFYTTMYGMPITADSRNPLFRKLADTNTQTEEIYVCGVPQPELTLQQVENTLNQRSSTVYSKIYDIEKGRNKDPQYENYLQIYHALRALQSKSLGMLGEQKVSPDRQDKARNVYKLTLSLYDTCIEFLSQNPEDRAAEIDSFVPAMQHKLNSIENRAFIDRHENSAAKFVYENWGFFPTATRNKLSDLERACQRLQLEPEDNKTLTAT